MSFLNRIFGNRSDSDEPVRWSWPRIGILPLEVRTGDYSLELTGTSQYQQEIKAARKLHQSRNVPVYLNREPRNPDDPNAVAIMSANQQNLGYLRPEDASRYSSVLDDVAAAGLRTTCTCMIAEGDRRGEPKLAIDVSRADEIREQLVSAVRDMV